MMKYYLSLALTLFLNTILLAQKTEVDIKFHGFADNREYAQIRNPQTMFGTRISPEIGILADSVHRIRVGLNYLHEFGSKRTNSPIRPVAYYNYKKGGIDFNLGMFSRHEYLGNYPLAMLSDTISYYHPNIEGMLLKYENKRFHQQLWIDWTSRQTTKDREQFMVGISGNVNFNEIFYVRHHAIMWHNALTENSPEDENIQDNGAGSAQFGANLSNKTFLDSLNINAGIIVNFDRIRNEYDLRFAKGFTAEVYAEYRKIFVRNTYFSGEALQIPYGDVFYRTKKYNRLDIGWIPLRHKKLEGRFTAGFHFIDGKVENQQQFILRYNIGYRSKSWN